MIELGAIRLRFAWNWLTKVTKSLRRNRPRKSRCWRRGLMSPWMRSNGNDVRLCCWHRLRYFSYKLIASPAPYVSATILSAQFGRESKTISQARLQCDTSNNMPKHHENHKGRKPYSKQQPCCNPPLFDSAT